VGLPPGNPLNPLLVMSVHATICREVGIPLRFPGPRGNYEALYQVTDVGLSGRVTVLGAILMEARNEASSIANGDYLRWVHLWLGWFLAVVATRLLLEVAFSFRRIPKILACTSRATSLRWA